MARVDVLRGDLADGIVHRATPGVSGVTYPARYSRSGDLFAPKPLRRKVAAVAPGLQLRPHDRRGDPLAARESAEAAVGRGDDALAVAGRRDRLLNATRDHFRM